MSRPILVVDDDPAILATVSDALLLEGLPVRTATNGAEALVLIETEDRPSLVLLDLRMPVLAGWGFMRAVRPDSARFQSRLSRAACNTPRASARGSQPSGE